MPTPDPPAVEENRSATRHYILGTAGHIDHGKTSLVRALTGTDPDRLPEEKRRGMTIELGFAELRVGDIRFGVVDVPGHERFVRTMVAGATAIDIAVLVVAADDSVMPQTVEHVDILNLLGVRRGVVALTKIDMVDPSLIELVAEEVGTLLHGSPLEHAPICPVSSGTGQGLDDLKQQLARAAGDVHVSPPQPPFRMAIDRVFTVQGRGTVVTGSVLRGTADAGDVLELLPTGETCRVRGLQSHGVDSDRVLRGQRAAINLGGVDRQRIERGCELATPGYLKSSYMIDVRLQCLGSARQPIASAATVRLGMGTRETPVRVVLYESERLEPGAVQYAQLRSGEPLVAVHGQRFILRDASATRTIGGGTVLSPVASRRRGEVNETIGILQDLDRGDEADRVEQVLRLARFSRLTDLQLCARAGIELAVLPNIFDRLRSEGRWLPVAGTNIYAVPTAVDDLVRRLNAWLERYHRTHPDEPGRKVDSVLGWLKRMADETLARPLLERLVADRTLKRLGAFVCLPAFAPQLSGADERLLEGMLAEFRAGGFQPPSLESLKVAAHADRKRIDRLVTLAVAIGELVPIEPKMYLHADVERRLRDAVQALIAERGPVTVAEVREVLASSRKFVVPFLEYLDRIGFTRRIDDRRVLAEESWARTR